jgi:hypothetical protein
MKRIFAFALIIVMLAALFSFRVFNDSKRDIKSQWSNADKEKFFALYSFPLSLRSKEIYWSNALAKKVKGEREKVISAGRVDVETKTLAIEVERIEKWHEGIGQALHYGLYENKTPALAIIAVPPITEYDRNRLDAIESICSKYGIQLIVLTPN